MGAISYLENLSPPHDSALLPATMLFRSGREKFRTPYSKVILQIAKAACLINWLVFAILSCNKLMCANNSRNGWVY